MTELVHFLCNQQYSLIIQAILPDSRSCSPLCLLTFPDKIIYFSACIQFSDHCDIIIDFSHSAEIVNSESQREGKVRFSAHAGSLFELRAFYKGYISSANYLKVADTFPASCFIQLQFSCPVSLYLPLNYPSRYLHKPRQTTFLSAARAQVYGLMCSNAAPRNFAPLSRHVY